MKKLKLVSLLAVILILAYAAANHAATLLADDFESYAPFPSGAWTNASGNGSWGIASDGSKVARQTATSSATYLMVNGDSNWINYSYSAKVKPGSSGNRHGLVARFTDANNYYFLILKDGSKVYLYKRVNGSETALGYTSFTYNSSTFYTLRIELNGSSLSGYVNGSLMISATDSSLSAGKVGFYTYGNASFDDVTVSDSASATPTPTPSVPATPTPTPTAGSYSKLSLSVLAASADDGNAPANVLDADLSTRFSSSGDGAYIILDANGAATVAYVRIAWHNGSTRQSYFEIYTSTDNQTYTKAYPATGNGTSSGTTTALETYDFTDGSARYIKVIGHGNSSNAWFSPTEIEAWGSGPIPTPTPTPIVSPTPTPGSGSPTPTPSPAVTPTPPATGTVYRVTSSSQWSSAVSSAQPGDIIEVTGSYSSGLKISGKTASASNPITIRAASSLGTTLYSLEINNCQGIVVRDFQFGPNTSGVLLKVVNSKDVAILRNMFDHNNIAASQSSIVTTQASDGIEIGYNTFDRKNVGSVSGSYIKTQFDSPNITKNLHIHHNYFKNIVPMPDGSGGFKGDSDRETIVFGVSGSQDILTNHRVEYNLFEDCDGENEIITVKTSQNIIRYNTFKNCLGSVSVRFGTRTEVYGNFFIGEPGNPNNYETGGVRVYGSYHRIYNNYFQGLTGAGYRAPFCLDGGDTSDSSGGDGHERPTYCEFTNNTIVDSAWGIDVGTHYSLSPQNCEIANNIISGDQNHLFTTSLCDATNTFEGNIAYPTGSATLGVSGWTQNEIWQTNPNLATVNGLRKLSGSSPAINYSKGSYSYVADDLDGQARLSTSDAGADEYYEPGVSVSRRPLNATDVGYGAP